LEFGDVGFEEGGKPENLEKNPGSEATTNNKLNPHMALGHIGGRQALPPLRHPCSPITGYLSKGKNLTMEDSVEFF